MHRVTLHKSLDGVDVTYKADVKFNVMGARAKSGCIAAHSALQLRHGLDTYLRAWCINIDHLISYGAKKTGAENFRRTSACLPVRSSDRKLERALLFIRDEKSPSLDFRYKVRGRRSDLHEIAVDCLAWEESAWKASE